MTKKGECFHLDMLLQQAQDDKGNYLEFINNEKLSSGIYELKKGEEDLQQPHEWDELYFVLEGEAQLRVEETTYEARSGSILFVAARAHHKFINIKEDLEILVFFSKKE